MKAADETPGLSLLCIASPGRDATTGRKAGPFRAFVDEKFAVRPPRKFPIPIPRRPDPCRCGDPWGSRHAERTSTGAVTPSPHPAASRSLRTFQTPSLAGGGRRPPRGETPARKRLPPTPGSADQPATANLPPHPPKTCLASRPVAKGAGGGTDTVPETFVYSGRIPPQPWRYK